MNSEDNKERRPARTKNPVLIELAVLGIMVVAAAVVIFILFGQRIRAAFASPNYGGIYITVGHGAGSQNNPTEDGDLCTKDTISGSDVAQ